MAEVDSRPPSVDALARSLVNTGLPHPLRVDAARSAIAEGDPGAAREIAQGYADGFLRPVINATGVLLHTNLGRAPRPPLSEFAESGIRYSNLEFDVRSGKRGSRHSHAASLLARLCKSEDALVVNNCAAAVTLALAALAKGRGVAVSRSELVEIGGGFRVPEVIATSNARLVEVGTTNRTRIDDYQRALAEKSNDVAALLKVHQSNYRIVGFTESASIAELAELRVPLVVDIGSGLIDEACWWLKGGAPSWLRGEPAARSTLAAGADLVTFSGDKLLGGPQAGIIAGKAELVQLCARHPLARAFRAGALTLVDLQSLALTYLHRRGGDIPFWRMAATTEGELMSRAESLGVGSPRPMSATTGGGTLPGVSIPSAGISLPGDFSKALRKASVPIISRVSDQQTFLDLRCVDPLDDESLAAEVRTALGRQ